MSGLKRITVLPALLIMMTASHAEQQPTPPASMIANPNTGGNLMSFFSVRTPYEFWLTSLIGFIGLIIIAALIWSVNKVEHRRPEDITRPIVVVTIIIGTLILVTAGYSNEQIAPAFGLFGTIVGYILGRLAQQSSADAEKIDQSHRRVVPVMKESPGSSV
jgi:glycerol uptake facilitator-like aquaporin